MTTAHHLAHQDWNTVRRCACGVALSHYNADTQCVSCARRQTLERRVQQLPPVRVTLPEVGPLLKAWRTEHHATQSELARLLDFDASYVSLIETGKRALRDIEHLARVSVRLGFPPELLGLASSIIRPAELAEVA
jgi:DNA-binding XRE family transcriptional regulator